MELVIELVEALTAGHSGLTAGQYFLNAVLGAIGAFVAAVASSAEDRIELPRYLDGQISLGVVGTLVVGAGAALVVGYGGWVPLVAGMVAEIVVPAVLEMVRREVERWKR